MFKGIMMQKKIKCAIRTPHLSTYDDSSRMHGQVNHDYKQMEKEGS